MGLNRPSPSLKRGALTLSYKGKTSFQSEGSTGFAPAVAASLHPLLRCVAASPYRINGRSDSTFLIAARSVVGLTPMDIICPAWGPSPSNTQWCAIPAAVRRDARARSRSSSGTASATAIVPGSGLGWADSPAA